MLGRGTSPAAPFVAWIATLLATIPGGVAFAVFAGQSGTTTFAWLGFAWICGVIGARFLTAVALPWSRPPLLSVAILFGASFSSFVITCWEKWAPKRTDERFGIHLALGFAGGLVVAAIFSVGMPASVSRLDVFLVGAGGGSAFATLRYWMLR